MGLLQSLPATVDGDQHGPDYGATQHPKWKQGYFYLRLPSPSHPNRLAFGRERTARQYVNNIFPWHGLSKTVMSDRNSCVTSASFNEVFILLGTELKISTANHPQTNGQAEHMNQLMEETLHVCGTHRQDNWDETLPCKSLQLTILSKNPLEEPLLSQLWSAHDPLTLSVLIDTFSLPSEGNRTPRMWTSQRPDHNRCLTSSKGCIAPR